MKKRVHKNLVWHTWFKRVIKILKCALIFLQWSWYCYWLSIISEVVNVHKFAQVILCLKPYHHALIIWLVLKLRCYQPEILPSHVTLLLSVAIVQRLGDDAVLIEHVNSER